MGHGTKYFRALILGILVSGLIYGCGILEEESLGSSPLIKRFVAMPNPVNRGESVVLRWEVYGAERIQIEPGIGLVSDKGLREVQLASTTTYTLSARTGTSVWTTSIEIVVSGSSPESPTPTPTASPTTPTATPTPTPAPTQTPIPTPTPTASAPPDSSQLVCEEESTRHYRDIVIQAQELLKAEKPDWFDYETLPGWVITKEPEGYFNAMIETINEMDGGKYQAHPHFYEPDSHIAVKASNDFSEAYHIITSFHGLTNGYAFTCRPAEF